MQTQIDTSSMPYIKDTSRGSDSTFFALPPAEIGIIRSKFSSLRISHEGITVQQRQLLSVSVGMLVLILGFWLGSNYEAYQKFPASFILTMLVSGAVGMSIWFDTGSDQFCEYIGDSGVARFKRSGSGGHVTQDMLLFQEVKNLDRTFSSHVEPKHYLISNIDEEESTFTWKDLDGRVRFHITGINTHQDNFAPPLESYLFGCAVEKAWTSHLINQAGPAIKSRESISFALPGSHNLLRLSSEQLEYYSDGKIQSCPVQKISNIFRSHEFLILNRHTEEEDVPVDEIDPIPLKGFPNDHFFFSLLESFTGLKMHAFHNRLPSADSKPLDKSVLMSDTSLFRDRLTVAMASHKRNKKQLLVLIIDFNNLVNINHTLGHEKGTVAIREVSNRLIGKLRKADTVARLEGTEFEAILSDFKDAGLIPDFLKELQTNLTRPIKLGNDVIMPDIYIGYSYYPKESADAESLIRKARISAYCVKYQDLFHINLSHEKEC
jgi:diguanylate cyclase (GGDEF)-like protein